MDKLFFVFYLFIIFVGFIYYFFGKQMLCPFRKKKMEKLAHKLGLVYKKSQNVSIKEKLFSYTKQKNIIKGDFNDKEVIIYDFDSATNFLNVGFPHGQDSQNVTYINGRYYKDKFLPYLSVDKIEKIIKGELSLPEYIEVSFNKGIFLIFIVFAFFITIIIHYYFVQTLNFLLLGLMIVMINIIIIGIGYVLAKKDKYRMPMKESDQDNNI